MVSSADKPAAVADEVPRERRQWTLRYLLACAGSIAVFGALLAYVDIWPHTTDVCVRCGALRTSREYGRITTSHGFEETACSHWLARRYGLHCSDHRWEFGSRVDPSRYSLGDDPEDITEQGPAWSAERVVRKWSPAFENTLEALSMQDPEQILDFLRLALDPGRFRTTEDKQRRLVSWVEHLAEDDREPTHASNFPELLGHAGIDAETWRRLRATMTAANGW